MGGDRATPEIASHCPGYTALLCTLHCTWGLYQHWQESFAFSWSFLLCDWWPFYVWKHLYSTVSVSVVHLFIASHTLKCHFIYKKENIAEIWENQNKIKAGVCCRIGNVKRSGKIRVGWCTASVLGPPVVPPISEYQLPKQRLYWYSIYIFYPWQNNTQYLQLIMNSSIASLL